MAPRQEDGLRLAAALIVAGLLGVAIAKPDAPRTVAERAAAIAPDRAPLADRDCPLAGTALAGPFAPIDDIISISPLGGVTAPDEPLPAPHIRINTRKGETVFERRMTQALAPARADVSAIERRVVRDEAGLATGLKWKVHFRTCNDISLAYDDLDEIDLDLLARVGGLAAFSQVEGPDRMAVKTALRVRAGDVIGRAAGFDVALEDRSRAPEPLIRPERYRPNPYLEARVRHADPALIAALADDPAHARCPLDYLPAAIRSDWSALLGDAYGMRRARSAAAGGGSDSACRSAILDKAGSAQGVWYTDAAHNALTARVSAIALAPDAVDPARQIFSLHGRLPSLTAAMVALPPKQDEARAEAARDFLTFDGNAAPSGGRAFGVNIPFDQTATGGRYCYDGLRANFVGPRISGVILLGLEAGEDDAALMKIEARGDVMACADLADDWAFSGGETVFYR